MICCPWFTNPGKSAVHAFSCQRIASPPSLKKWLMTLWTEEPEEANTANDGCGHPNCHNRRKDGSRSQQC
jgi:hypothetical protein